MTGDYDRVCINSKEQKSKLTSSKHPVNKHICNKRKVNKCALFIIYTSHYALFVGPKYLCLAHWCHTSVKGLFTWLINEYGALFYIYRLVCGWAASTIRLLITGVWEQDIQEINFLWWNSDVVCMFICLFLFYSMDESYRPVKLRKVVLGFAMSKGMSEFRFDLSLNYKMSGIIQTYSDRKPTIVVSTRDRRSKYLICIFSWW